MGSYEEEYRKYYSNAKAKLNIKSHKEKKEKKFASNKEVNLKEGLSRDIYPKTNYSSIDEKSYDNENNNYIVEDFEKINYITEECDNNYEKNNYEIREEEKKNYIMPEAPTGTYMGLESYSGINNYSGMSNYTNSNNYRIGNGASYQGYGVGNSSKVIKEEKSFLEKLVSGFIIKLVLTVVLFMFVIGLKFSPYEETKIIYQNFKESVNRNFEYEKFIEDVKSVDVMKEINDIKDNIKIKAEDLNTFEVESDDGKGQDSNSENPLDKIDLKGNIMN